MMRVTSARKSLTPASARRRCRARLVSLSRWNYELDRSRNWIFLCAAIFIWSLGSIQRPGSIALDGDLSRGERLVFSCRVQQYRLAISSCRRCDCAGVGTNLGSASIPERAFWRDVWSMGDEKRSRRRRPRDVRPADHLCGDDDPRDYAVVRDAHIISTVACAVLSAFVFKSAEPTALVRWGADSTAIRVD